MQSGYTRMSCRAVLCWRYRLVLTNFSKLFATSENVFLRSYGPKQSQRLLLLFILKEYDFSSIESGKDFTLLIEIKGNYIKAGTEMLKWISRWRTKVLGGGGESGGRTSERLVYVLSLTQHSVVSRGSGTRPS